MHYNRYYDILFKGLSTRRLWNPLGQEYPGTNTERHLSSKQNGSFLNGYLFTKYYFGELVLCSAVLSEYLTDVCGAEFYISF